jgi:hypothetical protein
MLRGLLARSLVPLANSCRDPLLLPLAPLALTLINEAEREEGDADRAEVPIALKSD